MPIFCLPDTSVRWINLRSSLIAALVLFMLPSLSKANSHVALITPSGGQVGTEVKVTIRGDRFKDLQELVWLEPGLKVKSLTVLPDKNDKIAEAVIEIPSDVHLGTYPCMLRTATGLSELRTFRVTSLPYLEEKEKNNEPEEAQVVELNSSISGKVTNEDLDYFAIDLKAGQRFTAEVEAMRLGNAFFDPHLALYNTKGNLVAACDDHPLIHQDAFINISIPSDDRYYLVVRDSSFGGSDSCQYLLHVGDFPRPTGLRPSGGPLPEGDNSVELTMIGDVQGDFPFSLTHVAMPACRDGNMLPVYAVKEGKMASSPNWYVISDLENVLEVEPNAKADQAQKLTTSQAVSGMIDEPGDEDIYVYTLKKGQQYDATVYGLRLRSRLDAVLEIKNMKGNRLKENDDQGGLDPTIRFDVPEDGEYQVIVSSRLKRGGVEYPYRLEITEVKPQLSMSTIDFDRYVTPTMTVPPGGCDGIIVNTTRRDFGGELKFIAESLPAGVKMVVPETWTSKGQIPVLFEAEESAPMGVGLSVITATHEKDGQVDVKANLVQSHMLVRGQNNASAWSEETKIFPVAVSQKYPFKIRAIQPKVPMVQNGTMYLNVEVEREEGFEEEISIAMLLPSSGLSANQMTIKGKETSGRLYLNTNNKTETGKFAISVRAKTKVNGDPVTVCTPFVELEITEPYLELEFEQATVQQGETTPMLVKVKQKKEFEGAAQVELMGLPAKANAENKEITKDSAELVFDVKAETDTPVGQHKSLFCKVLVQQNGESIEHRIYGGKLRVDEPSKIAMPEPKKEEPKEEAVAKKEEPPKKKPLSRIEQLRLLSQQADEGGK